MINRNALFCSINRYDFNLKDEESQQVIENLFYKMEPIADPATKLMVQKGLENNYDVIDGDSAVNAINELLSNGLYLHPFFSILYDLWDKKVFETSNLKELSYSSLKICEEYILSVLRDYYSSYDSDEEEYIVSSVVGQLSCFFEDEESLLLFVDFSRQYEPLMRLAHPYPFWGYGFYRVFDMAIKAYEVGYLTNEQMHEAINNLGDLIQSNFDSWQQYFASVLFGKLYITCKNKDAQNVFLLSREEFVNNLYGLVTTSSQVFISSGIWPNSDLSALKSAMDLLFFTDLKSKKYLLENGSYAQLEEKSIYILDKYILKPLGENNLVHYFSREWKKHHLSYALVDQEDGTQFWKRIQTFKTRHDLFFSEQEIPLLIIERCVLTTRNFYYARKKLFKEKMEIIPLEKVKFKCVVNSLKSASITVNGNLIRKNDLRVVDLQRADLDDHKLLTMHQANVDKICSILNTACNQLIARKGTH